MHEDETTLVCHVRAPLVADPIESRVETLRSLEDGPLVDTVVVRSWPETVRLDDEGDHETLARYERFRSWADRRGVSIRPPFETRTRSSIVEEDGVDVLVTPTLCLAVYREERLVGVFPHAADGETYTVEEAVDTLRSGELPRPLGSIDPKPTAEQRRCPDCEGALVNGQGVFICPDCAWVGAATADGWAELPTAGTRTAEAPSD
ncbi:HTH domain-containing protein [Natronomonas gomsonensis]|uniref:HTH domain-containing protein n=1 Tax=Natronomonas gomsonensis TaxID=1046043 RepID=UPI0015BD1455|nr:HTH domain-containing protein [Natronomonas gomsonensis]